MSTYLVAAVNVNDWEKFKKYQKGVLQSVSIGDGKVLAAGPAEALEGEEPRGLNVLFEFPSTEAAKRWYDSEEYQRVVPIRQESAPGANFILIEGLSR